MSFSSRLNLYETYKINNQIEALIENVENTCLFSLNINDILYKLGTSMIGSWVRSQFIKKSYICQESTGKGRFLFG